MSVTPVGHNGSMTDSVVMNQGVSTTVTPPPYGAGMDTSGVVGRPEASAEGFVSVVAATVGGLVWESMPAGRRQAWLSALTTAEGAIAASRAVAVACSAGRVGTAERTAELVRATGMSGRDAAGAVRTADVLAAAPGLVEALATGAITTGHVDAIVRDLPVGHRLAAVADPAVLAAAVSEGVDGFKAGMRGWQAHQDGDLDGSRLAARQRVRRRLSWATTGEGMVRFSGELTPEVGAVVTGAIQAESERLWRHEDDRAPDPADPAVGRSVVQRNADALERICRRANSGGAAGPGRVDLQVVVDYQVLASGVGSQVTGTDCTAGGAAGQPAPLTRERCQTSDGMPLPVAVVRRLACDAGVIPVVMGGASQVLDLGRRTRTVSTSQRNALIVRDGGCVFPGCDKPPSWCDAHHVIHWLKHGPSDLWNLVLLCSAHHHAVHEGGWGLAHRNRHCRTDGELVFTDPTGRRLAPEPPAARFRREKGSGQGRANWNRNGRGSGNGHGPVGQADRAGHGSAQDPPGNGHGHGHAHEQGQLLPARREVVQRR